MKTFSLLLLLSLSFSSFAKEGGNGGGTHVCGKRVELYDFYEGREARGHNIQIWKLDKKMNLENYLAKALAHIKQDIPEVHEASAKMIEKIMAMPKNEVFGDIFIPVIQDANVTILGAGCHYQQVANWNERFHKLFIDKNIFKKMDSLNQAGLIVHEAIYKLSRETSVANETSDLVREVVARIFSDEKLTKSDSEVISSEAARVKATKPMCDQSKKMISEIEVLMKKLPEAKTGDLLQRTVQHCLKFCLIPSEREFCEKKLN